MKATTSSNLPKELGACFHIRYAATTVHDLDCAILQWTSTRLPSEMSKLVEWATENAINIAVTAIKGTAALLIVGRTLHSFLSIGLATKSTHELATAVLKKKGTAPKLRNSCSTRFR
jgi:hypothetical protein